MIISYTTILGLSKNNCCQPPIRQNLVKKRYLKVRKIWNSPWRSPGLKVSFEKWGNSSPGKAYYLLKVVGLVSSLTSSSQSWTWKTQLSLCLGQSSQWEFHSPEVVLVVSLEVSSNSKNMIGKNIQVKKKSKKKYTSHPQINQKILYGTEW